MSSLGAQSDTSMNDLEHEIHGLPVELLLGGVQAAFEAIIEYAENKDDKYIIQKSVIHNAMHAFTDLMEAIDAGLLRD